MISTSTDLPSQKSLQIKQDGKFFCRLLSKESSISNPSFRVYDGVAAGAIPFMWESQPGTPKHAIPTTTPPPLAPPPSYHFTSKKKTRKNPQRSSLLSTIFPKLNLRKTHVAPSSSSSSGSSLSSLSSLQWSPTRGASNRRSPISSFSLRDDDEKDIRTPATPLCFGFGRKAGPPQGCYSIATMKNAMLSMVAHGSSQGIA